jgi:ketosteroid isomerase-like protein
MLTTLTPEAVTHFLHHFEQLAEREDFALVREFIAEDAFFRFNDGDHIGRAAIQAAFEKTWRGTPGVKKARFYLSEITVLSIDQQTASATYTWHWEGAQGDKPFAIKGRGTRVLRLVAGRLLIVHEHLSRFPAPR